MHRISLAALLLLTALASAQEGGRLMVAPEGMAGHCITMVSPVSTGADASSVVVVRVIVLASGKVVPVRTVSGAPAREAEAMNAVRLWRYTPYVRDGSPIDVVTDVRVVFEAGKPGGMITHPNH